VRCAKRIDVLQGSIEASQGLLRGVFVLSGVTTWEAWYVKNGRKGKHRTEIDDYFYQTSPASQPAYV